MFPPLSRPVPTAWAPLHTPEEYMSPGRMRTPPTVFRTQTRSRPNSGDQPSSRQSGLFRHQLLREPLGHLRPERDAAVVGYQHLPVPVPAGQGDRVHVPPRPEGDRLPDEPRGGRGRRRGRAGSGPQVQGRTQRRRRRRGAGGEDQPVPPGHVAEHRSVKGDGRRGARGNPPGPARPGRRRRKPEGQAPPEAPERLRGPP